ncbi:unnamed protein product [Hymenolepis diminuta]|uniref:Transcriptional regulator n=1 Tax=Hymenolepis diminuta TaxID=6216 RepID=A0A0R3SGY1_HYMDI|nr:unnamed protein product [Hymenolepis diminuta]
MNEHPLAELTACLLSSVNTIALFSTHARTPPDIERRWRRVPGVLHPQTGLTLHILEQNTAATPTKNKRNYLNTDAA